jgi:hypothetical protein
MLIKPQILATHYDITTHIIVLEADKNNSFRVPNATALKLGRTNSKAHLKMESWARVPVKVVGRGDSNLV